MTDSFEVQDEIKVHSGTAGLLEPEGSLEAIFALAQSKIETFVTYKQKIGLIQSDEYLVAKLFENLDEIKTLIVRAEKFLKLSKALDDDARAKLDGLNSELEFVDDELSKISKRRLVELSNLRPLKSHNRHLQLLAQKKEHRLPLEVETGLAETRYERLEKHYDLFEENLEGHDIRIDPNDTDATADLWDVIDLIADDDREKRKFMSEQLSAKLGEDIAYRKDLLLRYIFEKFKEDVKRGYESWLTQPCLENDVPVEFVEALAEASQRRYDVYHKWLALKAKLLKIDDFNVYDRKAPLNFANDELIFSQEDALKIIRETFYEFSTEFGEMFDKAIEDGWLDFNVGGHPVCEFTVPGYKPLISLSFTGTIDNVASIIHEIAHGIHYEMARKQGIAQAEASATTLETASIFFETRALSKMLAEATAKEKITILAKRIDDHADCIFRQMSMHQFEASLHNAVEVESNGCSLDFDEIHIEDLISVKDVCNLWLESQRALYGSEVEFYKGFENDWSIIPQMYFAGMVHSYGLGQNFATGIEGQYQLEGAALAPKLQKMLEVGSASSPKAIAALGGIDIEDPNFFDRGIDTLEAMIDELGRLIGPLSFVIND